MAGIDVAIIGCGAAGIAAARHLVAAGRRVVVLEARSHAGGRAVVDHSLGVPVDRGAAWLHFADENAWTPLTEQAGCTILRDAPGWGPEAYVGARAPTATEREAARAHYQHYDALIAAAADAGRDVAVAEVVPHDAYRPRFDAVMTWAVGRESHEISTLDLQRYAESDLNWAVQEGLGSVVAWAARDLPVQFDAHVTAVDWSGDRVRIESTRGMLEAAATIVTVPTSVLAEDRIRFHPALPAAHRDAIAALPLGVVNKVIYRLDDPDFAASLPRHFLGSASTSRTCSWQARAARQPVLLAFFGGDLSWELEQRGQLEAFAREEFTRLFGSDAAAHLGPSLVTAWGSDALARGSYSAARPGQADSRTVLATPVSPRLQFAGEACDPQYFGTLHGAWRSGMAAAARLTA